MNRCKGWMVSYVSERLFKVYWFPKWPNPMKETLKLILYSSSEGLLPTGILTSSSTKWWLTSHQKLSPDKQPWYCHKHCPLWGWTCLFTQLTLVSPCATVFLVHLSPPKSVCVCVIHIKMVRWILWAGGAVGHGMNKHPCQEKLIHSPFQADGPLVGNPALTQWIETAFCWVSQLWATSSRVCSLNRPLPLVPIPPLTHNQLLPFIYLSILECVSLLLQKVGISND